MEAVGESARISFSSPQFDVKFKHLGSWIFKEFNLEIDPTKQEDGNLSFNLEELNKSLPEFAHLGFQIHPTNTPTIIPTHKRAINIKILNTKSQAVEASAVSKTYESTAMAPKIKKTKWPTKPNSKWNRRSSKNTKEKQIWYMGFKGNKKKRIESRGTKRFKPTEKRSKKRKGINRK